MLKLLIDAGADVNQTDHKGTHIIHGTVQILSQTLLVCVV
jgi:hypothetical protein